MEPKLARVIWHRLEPLNAVTYFCQECRDAPAELGLKGFWMGYFANRAAPMGPVGPGVVEATFFNFNPDRIRRAIPDAWDIVDPAELAARRADAAATTLRRILGDEEVERLAADVLPSLHDVIGRASGAGRPLFAGNRDLDVPSDPVAALWQAATTLREHRGDGHVALLTGAGLDGLEAHVLFAISESAPVSLFRESRGWSADEWQAAVDRLTDRGLLSDDETVTAEGRALRDDIEARTDELAAQPYAALSDDDVQDLIQTLTPHAKRIGASGELVFPNPMGLPDSD